MNESEREKARGVPLWHRLCSFCHSLHLLGKHTYTRTRTRSRTSQTEGYWWFFFVSCFCFPPTPSIYLQGIRSSFFSCFLLCSYPIELTQQVLASNHPFFFPPFYLSTLPPFLLSLSPFLHTWLGSRTLSPLIPSPIATNIHKYHTHIYATMALAILH